MLACQKDKFTLPDNKIYLNCAYMSPLMKSVEEAGIAGIVKKRNPAELTASDFFTDVKRLRKEFAQLVNSKDTNRVAIIPSVSYGIANVARNVKIGAGNNVLVLEEQFPSNYYTWKKLCETERAELKIISAPKTLTDRGKGWNDAILNEIDKNTRVVSMAHVHWADGTKFDLMAIRKRTREVGALLVIDGTQSVGALPFDIEKIQPDALICAGYKWLMGPYAIGLAYYGEAFSEGTPIEENWINRLDSEDFARLVSYQDNYQPGALRYEVGEHSNFILVPMMIEALKQLNQWKPENIQQYCRTITHNALVKLSGAQIEHDEYRASHLFGIRIPGGDMEGLKEALAGAQLAVSVRGDAIRVSPHVYNTEEDIQRLVTVINENL